MLAAMRDRRSMYSSITGQLRHVRLHSGLKTNPAAGLRQSLGAFSRRGIRRGAYSVPFKGYDEEPSGSSNSSSSNNLQRNPNSGSGEKVDSGIKSSRPDANLKNRSTSSSTRINSASSSSTLELSSMRDRMAMHPPVSALGMRARDSFDIDSEAIPLLTRMQDGSSAPRTSMPGQDGSSKSSSPLGDGKWQYLVAMCALSVVICYADRSNISTAVLPMAEQFGWDKAYQGVVLSTFFGGYALTQIIGGGLADKFGGKLVLAGGVALWSAFTAMTPSAAMMGTFPLLTARVLLGVGEGVAFPSIHSLIARNVPQASQSTAVGIVTAASYAGTALAFGVSPLIITQLGWPYVFYLFAAGALLWLPLWVPVQTVQVVPKRRVSDGGESGVVSAAEVAASSAAAATAAPAVERGFWALLKRKEVWAICAAQYCQSWGMYGLLNWLPTFFSDYYHIDLADLGSYTLGPYIVQGGMGLLSGVIADKLITSGWSTRTVRVMLQSIGMLGPGLCLLLAVSPIVGAGQPALASQLITVGLGLSALTLGGVSASHLDVAPMHAGVIFGAGNTAATMAGLLSVPFTGFLLQATNSWPLVFGVTALHYVVGTALWAMWCGGSQLPEDLDEAPPAAGSRSASV